MVILHANEELDNGLKHIMERFGITILGLKKLLMIRLFKRVALYS
jgi:hypothetical protein